MSTIQQVSTKLFKLFLSESTKHNIEKIILKIALVSFFVHLAIIYLLKFNILNLNVQSELLENPIAAIYTPFSFILIYEVYLLIYYLPKSFTTYINKQYEIITLIIIRKLFKDLASLELSSSWFKIKGDLQFTYHLIASLILFYLIYQFQKEGKRKFHPNYNNDDELKNFIYKKKLIAILLVPLFFVIAIFTLFNWSNLSFTGNVLPSLESINNLFFDQFFTVLILVDVVLLLISFFYTDDFNKIIRNSGFILSTILIRLSFGVHGLISTVIIVVAVLFGLMIIVIHNLYEKHNLQSLEKEN